MQRWKYGDRVVIARKVVSGSESDTVWVPPMDNTVGAVGTVITDYGACRSVHVALPSGEAWYYPHTALESYEGSAQALERAVQKAAEAFADVAVQRLRAGFDPELARRMMLTLGAREQQNAWAKSRGYAWNSDGVLVYSKDTSVRVFGGDR